MQAETVGKNLDQGGVTFDRPGHGFARIFLCQFVIAQRPAYRGCDLLNDQRTDETRKRMSRCVIVADLVVDGVLQQVGVFWGRGRWVYAFGRSRLRGLTRPSKSGCKKAP